MERTSPCLLVAVNYNTDGHASRLAASLSKYSPSELAVVLVDNSDRADSSAFFAEVRARNAHVECVKAPLNLGYFGGARLGYEHYLSGHEHPEWVLISNVDLQFEDPGFFTALRELDKVPDIGVAAPCIWSRRWKLDINPKIVSRPTRRRMKFYKWIFARFYLHNAYELMSYMKRLAKRVLRKRNTAADAATHEGSSGYARIYAPHGSCIALNQKFFLRGGRLDYPVFLFGEEIFVAETARRLGLAVVHYPRCRVLDEEHASTGILRSRRIVRLMSESTDYLLHTHFAKEVDDSIAPGSG